MELAILILGYLGAGIASLIFVPQVVNVVKKKSAEALSKKSFLTTYFCALSWIFYGAIKHQFSPWLSNVCIGLLMLPIIYYLFKGKKLIVVILSIVMLVFITFALTYSFLPAAKEFDFPDTVTIPIVVIASAIAVYSWCPQIIMVIKTKNVEDISLATFLLFLISQSITTVYFILILANAGTDVSTTIAITASSLVISQIITLIVCKLKYGIKSHAKQAIA